ncbi:glycosyltransferase family protein [Pseudodesulfovibrio pelocollis]|uniref:glycosyltransferase family protein n=1 Tax=Pseudodesulfovibrio pelocollis TaxID=3051432 RepID=UPI00255AF5A5|nr:glycosyltransferase family protein [Pseudodesulfovibrio sp. SB368]
MSEQVTAIVQARMGSSRLPGKILKPVLGRPLLAHEIERLKRCTSLREIVLATSDQPGDDSVAALGAELGVHIFRGSESDVLDRYTQAARAFDARNVMRVTGDCPLIEPAICDRTVASFFDAEADYITTPPRVAEGLDCEVFTRAALETAWTEARRPSEREHVTLFIRNRPDRFRCLETPHDSDDSGYRVTVDEPEDLTVVTAILEALVPLHGLAFTFSHVRDFLDAHPEIRALNSDIVRNEGLIKSLRQEDATS